jgi:hypothetical protein
VDNELDSSAYYIQASETPRRVFSPPRFPRDSSDSLILASEEIKLLKIRGRYPPSTVGTRGAPGLRGRGRTMVN